MPAAGLMLPSTGSGRSELQAQDRLCHFIFWLIACCVMDSLLAMRQWLPASASRRPASHSLAARRTLHPWSSPPTGCALTCWPAPRRPFANPLARARRLPTRRSDRCVCARHHRRLRTLDQQAAQVVVAAFGDAAQVVALLVLDLPMARLLASWQRPGRASARCIGVARQALGLRPTALQGAGALAYEAILSRRRTHYPCAIQRPHRFTVRGKLQG